MPIKPDQKNLLPDAGHLYCLVEHASDMAEFQKVAGQKIPSVNLQPEEILVTDLIRSAETCLEKHPASSIIISNLTHIFNAQNTPVEVFKLEEFIDRLWKKQVLLVLTINTNSINGCYMVKLLKTQSLFYKGGRRYENPSCIPVKKLIGPHFGRIELDYFLGFLDSERVSKERIAADEAMLESFIRQSMDGFLLTNERGEILLWNRALEAMTGIFSPEALGRPLWEIQLELSPSKIKTPEHLTSLKDSVNSFLSSQMGEWLTRDYTIHRRDGAKRTLETVIFSIHTSKGARIGTVMRDVTERKKLLRELESSNHAKETLLKDIHHRVKNSLQMVSNILQIGERNLFDTRDRDLFRESRNRIQSIATLHKSLYQSSNMGEVEISRYVHEITDQLLETYKNTAQPVNVTFDMDKGRLKASMAQHCGLILSELLTNSLKYARPELPQVMKIEICIHFSENHMIMSVRDHGNGLPAGFNIDETTSLGLKLVKTMTEQLNGQLTVKTIPALTDGTEFSLTIPLDESVQNAV